MNPDQVYDERREQDDIDRANALEADACMTHFREHGLAVGVAVYPSRSIRGIDVRSDELAKHADLSPQRVASIMATFTGREWKVTGVEPTFGMGTGLDCYPNLPITGIRIVLSGAL